MRGVRDMGRTLELRRHGTVSAERMNRIILSTTGTLRMPDSGYGFSSRELMP